MKMKTADYFFRFPFHIFFLLLFLFTRFFSVPFVQRKNDKMKTADYCSCGFPLHSFFQFFLPLIVFFPGVPNLQRKKKSNENS